MLRGEDKLNLLHGNTQIPKVVGLARQYELTGEASFHAVSGANLLPQLRRAVGKALYGQHRPQRGSRRGAKTGNALP
jgi:hypothetical protein